MDVLYKVALTVALLNLHKHFTACKQCLEQELPYTCNKKSYLYNAVK